MAVSQARLNRYRKDLDGIGDAAYSFVDEFIRATISNNPGMSVAELRNEAIDAIDSSLYAFGDQASELALDLFEEIVVDGYGFDADTIIEDVIDPDMIEGGVRYSARRLVEGDTEAFTRDVADLTRYYIKRSAMETMERNCHRNDLRYARVPSGRETCAFCFMLSSRGFVYRSEQTAGSSHAYHRDCDCVIVPGFKGLDPTDQVEGYDPDGMLDRWNECQAAAGSDSDLRDEWGSMGKKERAQYKGGSDAERYKRFVNAKAMREVETRDWRWLYTGKTPEVDYVKPRVELESHERVGVDWLKASGYAITTVPEDPKASVNLDLKMNGELWEMKNVTNAGSSVKNQMARAKKKWAKLGNPGEARIVLTMVGCSASSEDVIDAVSAMGGFRQVLIIGENIVLRIRK